MLIRFMSVKLSRAVSGDCCDCGKKVRQTITCEYTFNPFNKNVDGSVKNRDEVLKDVAKELEEKCAEPLTHRKCERSKNNDKMCRNA